MQDLKLENMDLKKTIQLMQTTQANQNRHQGSMPNRGPSHSSEMIRPQIDDKSVSSMAVAGTHPQFGKTIGNFRGNQVQPR